MKLPHINISGKTQTQQILVYTLNLDWASVYVTLGSMSLLYLRRWHVIKEQRRVIVAFPLGSQKIKDWKGLYQLGMNKIAQAYTFQW